jgi:hypothetical protein
MTDGFPSFAAAAAAAVWRVQVVPGLPSDQYAFTLALSAAGGVVAGLVTRIEPAGTHEMLQRSSRNPMYMRTGNNTRTYMAHGHRSHP